MRTSIFFTVLALIMVGFTSFGVAADEGSWTGWISGEKCASDYQKSASPGHVGCAQMCIKNGAKWALAMKDGAFILEGDSVELEPHLGHEVVVKGELDTATKTIKVSSVEHASD